GGAVLNSPPFAGNADGPGPDDPNGWPLVGLSPVAHSADAFAGAALITGHREFDAQVFGFRLGPYFELPLSKRWLASLSGGLAVLHVASDFTFDETVSISQSVSLASLPPERHHGGSSKS